jgi:membrane fusion protein (multidrug efflux system)
MSDATPPNTPPPAPVAAAKPAEKAGSKKPLIILATLFITVGIVYAVYHLLIGQYHVTTDNAYVGGNLVQITPQVPGTVTQIAADDTDLVQAGQLLVKLDSADSQVALAQAEADLASAVRGVRTRFSNSAGLDAQVAARQADVARAQSALAQALTEYGRRADLKDSGAVSGEELSNAKTAVASMRAQLAAAQSAVVSSREQLSAGRVQIEDTTVDNHPDVLKAAAAVRAAYLNNGRNGLIAPVSGYVAKRSAQLGARIQAGTPLMAIVPLDNLWVDANFKEAQLAGVRIGQPATLSADFYGSKVEYHGTVTGIGSGTGGAFALLPAQNATGNWIKVVQRLPVRIALDAKELKDHPLRIGLSMEVDVDIHDQSGGQLATAARTQPAYNTQVYADLASKADARIAEIINANAGAARAE